MKMLCRRCWILGLALTLLASLTLAAAGPTAPPPLKSYPKLIADFDPTLKPVQLIAPARPVKTLSEGKGKLEVMADGRRILHLRGTPYEMGLQHGRLLGEQVRTMNNCIMLKVGMEETMRTGEPFIERLRKAYAKCKPFIPAEYIEEARGLAAGSGLSLETVELLNIFPELFHCSGFALWGKATADGKLYHGRILDYMNGIGLQDAAVIFVYEPAGKVPWVNIGYAGCLGSVTGMNAAKIGLGEMGGRGGVGQWDGMPMSYLMRRVLENSKTLDDALKIFKETPRTCEYYYVVSDGKIPSARGLKATPEKLEMIGPGQAHPQLPNPVEDGVLMSATERYQRLTMRAHANYGRFDPATCLALMRRPVAMQSCTHAALFCPIDGRFWVANATADRQPASEQPYAQYNLNDLLKRGTKQQEVAKK